MRGSNVVSSPPMNGGDPPPGTGAEPPPERRDRAHSDPDPGVGAAVPVRALLDGVRIIEVSLLGGAAMTTTLADLGAEIIKVEPPSGDYIREMTWPIVEGVSLLHLHLNRGKRSVVLDLKHPAGVALFEELVVDADAVVEAMRPGQLDKLGIGYAHLRSINPRIVMMSFSGYGLTGPYRALPSHGIAFDVWAGVVSPATDEDGFCYLPEHVSIGINAGPIQGALGLLAGVISARATGLGCHLELAQADAAVAFDWYRHESWRASELSASGPGVELVPVAPDAVATVDGARHAVHESADGHIVLMAAEQVSWHNFCAGVGRMDLVERWPAAFEVGPAGSDHALRVELRDLFRSRTTAEWVAFACEHDTAIAPMNTHRGLHSDPQFVDRVRWHRAADLGADQLPLPIKLIGAELPEPTRAPTLGRDTDEVLRTVLGKSDDEMASLRAAGVHGSAGGGR